MDPKSYQSSSRTTTQNGVSHHHQLTDSSGFLEKKVFPRFQSLPGLDFKRVQSDALPKHQIASTVNAADHAATTSVTTEKKYSKNKSGMSVTPNINNNTPAALEGPGSDSSSRHHDLRSVGNNREGRNELKSTPSLSSITETQKVKDLARSNSPQPFDLGASPSSPVGYDSQPFGTGKSQSVTELSTISPLPLPMHTRDKSDTGVSSYYRSHSKAKKTESLPGKFRAQSLNFKDSSSPSRSNVSTPGMGLGLTNISIEDMHSASKLQIDQIWKEVESSSSLVSPVDDDPDERTRHDLHMDTIYTQTPDEWLASTINDDAGDRDMDSETEMQRRSSSAAAAVDVVKPRKLSDSQTSKQKK